MTAGTREPWHGFLEGFYGQPYSDESRLDLVRWLPSAGGRDYVYAPKDDPWQRAQWREPYPAERLDYFADLVRAGVDAGVRVGFVISPGLDWRDGDEAALIGKLQAFYDLGARALGVAFDDVPPGGADLGARHGQAVAAAVTGLPADVHWAACPVDYATDRVTSYLGAFADELPGAVDLMWTGPAVVSPDVPADLTLELSASLGRSFVLADNWPVSDGAMAGVLHLGPYPARDPGVVAASGGVLFNGGPLPLASRIGVAAGLRWWRDPTGDRETQWRDVLAGIPGIVPLARACRSWLTDTGPDPELAAWAQAALTADDRRLETWLAAGCRAGLSDEWAAELEPWLQAWDWNAIAMAFVLNCLRTGTGAGPGGAFAAAEALRRVHTLEQQVFGIRYAYYPVTRRDGDAEYADAAGLVRGETLTDLVCRRVFEILTGGNT